jgi:hypothetical protein
MRRLLLPCAALAFAACDGGGGDASDAGAAVPGAPDAGQVPVASSVDIDGQATAFDFGSAEQIGRESVTLTADARCPPSGRLCRLTIRLRWKGSGDLPAPGDYRCSLQNDVDVAAGTRWAWMTLSLDHDATPRLFSTTDDCTVTVGRLQREPAWTVSTRFAATLRRSDETIKLSNGTLDGMLMP